VKVFGPVEEVGIARVQNFGRVSARDPGFLISSWEDDNPYEMVCLRRRCRTALDERDTQIFAT
jgi:hypothetical protein